MILDDIMAIRKTIQGEMALTDDVALLLADMISKSDLHVETGTFWGGSAILAALAGARRVITIDSMEQFPQVTAGAILDNFARCGVAHRISMVKAKSNPWPLPQDVHPVTAFIDGDHSYEGCLADWLHLKDNTLHAIMFHDYCERKLDVMRVIDEVVRADERWQEIARAGSLIVFCLKGFK